MDDLISRQALMKEFADFVKRSNNSDFAPTPTWNDAVSLVGSMPSAEPDASDCLGCNCPKMERLVPSADVPVTNVGDMVSRQAALDALEREKSLVERQITETRWFDFGLGKAQDVLSELPSAEPQRKQGKWIIDPNDQDGYCSVCKCDMPVMMEDWCYQSVATNYCPNCGAEMKGVIYNGKICLRKSSG